MYRQKIIAVLADTSGVIQGTGIGECYTVTSEENPTREELEWCKPLRYAFPEGSSVVSRIPFSIIDRGVVTDCDASEVYSMLEASGMRKVSVTGDVRWFDCAPKTAVAAVKAVRQGRDALKEKEVMHYPPSDAQEGFREKKNTERNSHHPADALDWNEAMQLIERLSDDGRYRDSMLIASGCFLGLRISDLLNLRWCDILSEEDFTVTEKKTGKKRRMRINPTLKEHASMCFRSLGYVSPGDHIMSAYLGDGDKPLSRQRAWQILKECGQTYGIRSAKVFSTHSLRKTFGRRVWLRECDNGRGDQALVLLQQVFGHASVDITKRYLGIRQEEILSVYDNLM